MHVQWLFYAVLMPWACFIGFFGFYIDNVRCFYDHVVLFLFVSHLDEDSGKAT